MIKGAIVDAVLRKNGAPPWMKEYILDYLKGGDAKMVKYAMSFLLFGRKKGAITKNEVVLPNGKRFSKVQIAHLLDLCYYGEERIGQISRAWATNRSDRIPLHEHHFLLMADIESKRARAIKNLIEGLGFKLGDATEELKDVFDYVEGLTDWNERIITKKLLLNYSYARPFGYVMYKAFYPVSQEYMRNFGKAFYKKEAVEEFGEREAELVVRGHLIGEEKLKAITQNLLRLIERSIDAEMAAAKKAGIERELLLLKNISIAYPLYRMKELGVEIDAKKEIATIKRTA